MINIRKGSGLSLLQTDRTGNVATVGTIVQGSGVRLDPTTGDVLLGASASPTPKTDLLGFAINNDTDGDVIASGQLGMYLLNGGDVVETDQTAATITATNYPVGQVVTINTSGQVAVAGGSDIIIGQVDGIRQLPTLLTVNNVQVQGFENVLGIKLKS